MATMGRPKNEVPRDKKLTIMLTSEEKELIEKVAKMKNASRTDVIVEAVKEFLENQNGGKQDGTKI